jgi:hypothetical protein
MAEWIAEPLASVGGDARAGQDLLRVAGADMLSDGRLLVFNGNPAEIRVYSPQGEFTGTIGRPGQGPGEFELPVALRVLAGDTIAAFDIVRRRLTLFTSDGRIAAELALHSRDWASAVEAITPDGGLIAVELAKRGTIAPDTHLRIDTMVVRRYWQSNDRTDSLGAWQGATWYIHRSAGSESAIMQPLSPWLAVAASRSHTFVGHSSRPVISAFSTSTTDAPRSFTVPAASARLSNAVRARVIDELVAWSLPGRVERNRAVYEQLPMPEAVPAFEGLASDDDGLLWIKPFRLPDDTTAVWRVYAPDGTSVASVPLPPRMAPTRITAEAIIGIVRDPDMGDRVLTWRLTRTAAR